MLNNEPKLAKEIQDPKNALSNGKSLPSTCDFTAVYPRLIHVLKQELHELHWTLRAGETSNSPKANREANCPALAIGCCYPPQIKQPITGSTKWKEAMQSVILNICPEKNTF